MKSKNFSTHWKASKSPSKQRKYRYKAPAHIRQRFVSVNLNKTLRTQHNRRNIEARVGDKVKVLRGTHKGKVGNVSRIDRTKCKLIINGVETLKKDGSKTPYPIHASNCQIETLELKDKRRFKDRTKKLESNKSKSEQQSEQSSDVHMNSKGVNVEPVQPKAEKAPKPAEAAEAKPAPKETKK